ncbi:MAG: gliding motility lipoprotein GldK [Bacteroidetes bacterium MedPE-SWsnd-G1]|nr:MAG: gliding motility lipoprotein GldK [Bacteroidetes bacterium MedPE-SWsnd-G1]
MKRISIYILLAAFVVSCGSSDKGELVGVKAKSKWNAEKPYGMTLIPGGSFTMGKQDEDMAGALNTPSRTVTVKPFYMDETEISNSEYKEFVYWVRDSIVRSRLAEEADFMNAGLELEDPGRKLVGYEYKDIDTTDASPYVKYMLEMYGSLGNVNSPSMGRALNWDEDLVWNPEDFPDESYVYVMDSLYISMSNSFDGRRLIDTEQLEYRYYWLDIENAAKDKGNRHNYIKEEVLQVYPDTTVWVKDYNYSYNDPMHQDYFYHQAYQDYPVVGVSWGQANAFCNWRTQKKNNYLRGKKNVTRAPDYRLASEAEWEYAARGGLDFGNYPWGGPYTTSDRGCFLANFKPTRGDYAVDGALYTVEVQSYNANDYGLYNMAGNVSEWTNSVYGESTYYLSSTMNPNVTDKENRRKVIRGGSWKDVAYFLEVSSRDFEYADSARSYIGFRTVHDYLGTNIK